MTKSSERSGEVRRRLTYRFAPVPDWIITHPGLDATAVRVCAYLARFTESTYKLSTMAAECGGISENTVRRAVRQLQAVGAVSVEDRFDEAGRQTSNLYVVAGDSPITGERVVMHSPTTGGRAGGATGERGRVPRVVPKKDSVDLDVQDLEKPSLDPPDQAGADPGPTVNQRAKEISDRYWQWWKDGNNDEEPLTPFMGIRQVVVACLKAGWPEPEIKRAMKGCGGLISRAQMQRERSRRCPDGRVTDPTKAAMDSGRYGIHESIALNRDGVTIMQGSDLLRIDIEAESRGKA